MSMTKDEARALLHARSLRVTAPRIAVLCALADAALGIAAGLLLCVGHILNLRAVRRRRDACCDDHA